MNFEMDAQESAKVALDGLAVIETVYAGGITNGDDFFSRASKLLTSYGAITDANLANEKADILHEELEGMDQVGKDHPKIWPLLVQVRAEARRAQMLADSARIYADASNDMALPAIYDPHPWAYHATISAALCCDYVEQTMEILRDARAS